MDEIIDGLVLELSPIHAAVETFTKGGPECGRAVLKLYEGLLAAHNTAGDLRDRCDDLESENEDLKEEIAGMADEIIKLKPTAERNRK